MTNTETDLKPCQCGAGMLVDNSKPDLDPDWEALQAGVKFCASRDGDVCWIKCTKCYASTRPCNTEEQATKEWNDGKLLPPIASRFFSKPAENAFMSEEIPKRSKPFTNPATPDHGLDKAEALLDDGWTVSGLLDHVKSIIDFTAITNHEPNNKDDLKAAMKRGAEVMAQRFEAALSSPVVGNAVNDGEGFSYYDEKRYGRISSEICEKFKGRWPTTFSTNDKVSVYEAIALLDKTGLLIPCKHEVKDGKCIHCHNLESDLHRTRGYATPISSEKDGNADGVEDYSNVQILVDEFVKQNDHEDYPFKGEEYDLKLVQYAFDWLINNTMFKAAQTPPAAGWQGIESAPKDIDDYSGHGPYILIKIEESGHAENMRIHKIHTCYWDESAGWWQIDTQGTHEYCALELSANIIGWKLPDVIAPKPDETSKGRE
jgi:hypothetical protein